MISLVKIRELDIDDDFSLRGWTLQKAIDVSIVTVYLSRGTRPTLRGHSSRFFINEGVGFPYLFLNARNVRRIVIFEVLQNSICVIMRQKCIIM